MTDFLKALQNLRKKAKTTIKIDLDIPPTFQDSYLNTLWVKFDDVNGLIQAHQKQLREKRDVALEWVMATFKLNREQASFPCHVIQTFVNRELLNEGFVEAKPQ